MICVYYIFSYESYVHFEFWGNELLIPSNRTAPGAFTFIITWDPAVVLGSNTVSVL